MQIDVKNASCEITWERLNQCQPQNWTRRLGMGLAREEMGDLRRTCALWSPPLCRERWHGVTETETETDRQRQRQRQGDRERHEETDRDMQRDREAEKQGPRHREAEAFRDANTAAMHASLQGHLT